MLKTIVGHVGGRCKGEYGEQSELEEAPASSGAIKARIHAHIDGLFDFLQKKNDRRRFDEVERGLLIPLFALGRLFFAYYFAYRHEHSAAEVQAWMGKGFRKRKPERKYFNTFFGRVTLWRTYVRRPGGVGLHPLDLALGLPADGFSFLVMDLSARLSTLLSYEQVTAFFLEFLSWSPSKTTVEKAVLGFGRYTQEWFDVAPPPEGDGEVLVIQIDSKATPTATEEELAKRRGKRRQDQKPLSPRHRGRQKRRRSWSRKRKKKGDKSKNGKMATIVTMYTLKKARDNQGKPALLGPINKLFYSSYAPKRHAVAEARKHADKRGFSKESGKMIQIVTDGDEDLERYIKELFPKAKHTLDIVHVLEYLWEAGRFLYQEGSDELMLWVKRQESLLYQGKAVLVLQHIGDIQRQVVPRGRERLETIRDYIRKRLWMMDYDKLRKADLEVASGAVEGAVRHVIAKRFDFGSMRWIKERAEALLQLRCIEINGQWPAFVAHVQNRLLTQQRRDRAALRLLTTTAGTLPIHGVAA